MTENEKKEFISAYITTALWLEMDSNENPLEQNYSEKDLTISANQRIQEDCTQFLEKASSIIDKAIEDNAVQFGPDFGPYGRAGHDFFLTRNHHGAGYWDGDWSEPYGDQLTELAHTFGECNLCVEDNKIDFM